MLADDAQVLAANQNPPDHVCIPPMKAVVQERRCMDFMVKQNEHKRNTLWHAAFNNCLI